jgi:REP element-mobilizing transposase RayT
MARPLRFEYAGAVYHVMARGDGGKAIFIEKDDHLLFLQRLGEVCRSHGWRVHAWTLMTNHMHLLLETPEPNLVSGMRLLLGAFSQAWNRRYRRSGHVFQGRYKSVPVAGDGAGDASQFKVVADYIHLNAARAGLAGGKHGKLSAYPWSSLPAYRSGKAPEWLVFDRVLAAHQVAADARGRRSYAEYLEARAAADGGKFSPEATAALRRGWYLGDESFRDRLLALVEKGGKALRKKGSHSGKAVVAHGEREAERLVAAGLRALELCDAKGKLLPARKGDPRKVALATLVRTRTAMGNPWLAKRLEMGHDRSVSRLIRQGCDNRLVRKHLRQVEQMLLCED